MRPVYLDHNATTPLSPEARAAMEPYLEGQYGNPLTTHRFGASPRAALQWANNGVGPLQPVREIGRLCRELKIPLVCDAVQAAGKVDLSGALSAADAFAFSAHKMYGPKGVGALVIRKGLELDTLNHGATQEGGHRGGTHNVAGIVGFAAAARSARQGLAQEATRLAGLRDLLWSQIHQKIDGAAWN